MAKLRLEQILSNLSYDRTKGQLHISGSTEPSVVLTGSLFITSSGQLSGSLTIAGSDTFGDSGSFNKIDLGEF